MTCTAFKWRRYRQGRLGIVWQLEPMDGGPALATVRRTREAGFAYYVAHHFGNGFKTTRTARNAAWRELDKRSIALLNADIITLVGEEIIA